MNSFLNFQQRLTTGQSDWLPVQPLLMIFAADLIGVSYADYVRDHHILVKGQLASLEQFDLDVVSCCSDAWREAADCGTELEFPDHAPPFTRRHLIEEPEDFARLIMPDPLAGGRMTDRIEAITLFARQLKGEVPILGWIEGPYAEAADLYGLDDLMMDSLEEPEFVSELMDWVVEMETRFALAQVQAGADMIGMGDAAASLVSPDYYAREIAPREKKIIDAIHDAGASVRLHICGDIQGKFAAMAATGADMIDIDFPQTMAEARQGCGNKVCLCGNLNPVSEVLNSTPEGVTAALGTCFKGTGPRFIVGAGCEIPPGTPAENLKAMVEFGKQRK